MLVRREAGANRHGRAADRHTAAILQKLEIGVERQRVERLFRVGEAIAQRVEFESHFVSPYAVLLGHHCPTHTLARGNSECNPQLSGLCIFRIFILDDYLGGSHLYHPHLIIEGEDKDGL